MGPALALVDTGAAGSAISIRLAQELSLEQIDSGELREAGREVVRAPYFKARLKLPPNVDIEIDLIGLPMEVPHDVLIGRDILASCRLTVDFTSGVTCVHIRTA